MKAPEDRGPLAAWLYESRTRLDISPEQVVAELGRYNPATIRKAESLDENVSRPLWRTLTALYTRLAHERGKPIEQPPRTDWTTQPAPSGDQAALIAALLRQAESNDRQAEATLAQVDALNRVADRLDLAAQTWQGTAEVLGPMLDLLRETLARGGQRGVRELPPRTDVVRTGPGR